MIDSNAISIERRRVRVASVELGDALVIATRIQNLGTIRKGEGRKKWLHGCSGKLARERISWIRVRNGRQGSLRKSQAETFIREEKERSVLQNWAAESSSKVVLSLLGLW